MTGFNLDSISESLADLRASCQLTYKELSDMSGLSQSYLSDIEHGRTTPSLSALRKIATAYGGELEISIHFDGLVDKSHMLIDVGNVLTLIEKLQAIVTNS